MHKRGISSVAFSPDDRQYVVTSFDGSARIYRSADGQPLGDVISHGPYAIYHATFDKTGRLVATCGADSTARLWNAATGLPYGQPFEHRRFILYVVFHPDNLRILTAGVDRAARIWEIETGKPSAAALTHNDAVIKAIFSPDGKHVLTISHDKTASLWDSQTGDRLGLPMLHAARVMECNFSPDGRLLATGAEDGTVRLWQTSNTLPLSAVLAYPGRDSPLAVRHVAFDPLGGVVGIIYEAQRALLWKLPSEPAIRSAQEVRREAEAITGLELDDFGAIISLDSTSYLHKTTNITSTH